MISVNREMCAGDIRTLLRKESAMPILPSMNTFIELRQEEDYKHIFHKSTGLISQVLQGCNFILMLFFLPGGDLVQVQAGRPEGHDVSERDSSLHQED